jgi:hypothetical protein
MGPSTLAEICSDYNAVCVRKAQLQGGLPWDGGDKAARKNLKICRERYASACRRWRHGEADARAAVKLLE